MRTPSQFVNALLRRYPRLPTLIANTVVSKFVECIKNNGVDPAFARPELLTAVQSMPGSLQVLAEWIPYALSGTVRTLAKSEGPVSVLLEESLADSLNLVGAKISEVCAADRNVLLDTCTPDIKRTLVAKLSSEGPTFWNRVSEITGTQHDWGPLITDAEHAVDDVRRGIEAARTARLARGWRRFL